MMDWLVTFISGATATVQADDVEPQGEWLQLVMHGEGPVWAAPSVNILHVGRADAIKETARPTIGAGA